MRNIYRIKDLFPNVAGIKIHYTEEYRSCFGIFNEEHCVAYNPDRIAEFALDCINGDCTRKTFDLYSEVAGAVCHNEDKRSGTRQCDGRESAKHQHQCPVVLNYTILVEYLP